MVARKEFKCVQENNWIGGVCGGIAYAFGVPALLVRIVALLILLLPSVFILEWISGVVFVAYIVAWIFCPNWEEDPEDYTKRTA